MLYLSGDAASREMTIRQAARLLRVGEIVAIPTETVYGLAAALSCSDAILRIFSIKGRPSDNPLIVHIADKEDVHSLAQNVPPSAQKLIDRFWPGPLTIVFLSKDCVPVSVRASLETIALRMPDNLLTLSLIRAVESPLVAPSANLSGRPSPTCSDHVFEDFGEGSGVAAVIDGGACGIGIESTVVDVTCGRPQILRLGSIRAIELEEVLGYPVSYTPPSLRQKRSPGHHYRHYTPHTPLRLFSSWLDLMEVIERDFKGVGEKLRVIGNMPLGGPDYLKDLLNHGVAIPSPLHASTFYGILREADQSNKVAILIVVETSFYDPGLMDRVHKSAGQHYEPMA